MISSFFTQMMGVRGIVSFLLFYSVVASGVNEALSFSYPFTFFDNSGCSFVLSMINRKP